MADHDGLDDLVDANDLVEVARATRVLVLRLDGIKGQNGVLHRIESASDCLEKIESNVSSVVEKVGDIAKLRSQIVELPEHLLTKVDGVAFRSALSRVIVEVTGTEIEKLHQIELDHLDDELKFRADRLADDIFTRKMAPAMAAANELARAKSDAESYKTRAETAEKLIGNIEILSKKTEDDLIDQIERIRLSATQPNRLALVAAFALGWGCALFAADAWSALTHWLFQQPIPVWFLPRT